MFTHRGQYRTYVIDQQCRSIIAPTKSAMSFKISSHLFTAMEKQWDSEKKQLILKRRENRKPYMWPARINKTFTHTQPDSRSVWLVVNSIDMKKPYYYFLYHGECPAQPNSSGCYMPYRLYDFKPTTNQKYTYGLWGLRSISTVISLNSSYSYLSWKEVIPQWNAKLATA